MYAETFQGGQASYGSAVAVVLLVLIIPVMLFNMALTTPELEALASEVRRVLRPGGLHVYTVRHTADGHYGAGIYHGDGMYEHGGFIVHYFDRALVERLAAGFSLLHLVEFEEGDLPRRLWRVTLRKA